jgi:glycosyltransferase involved in cell wall biosynthesis
MKILELNFERGWRGGERQTLYNMQGFRDAGLEVILVCRKGYPLEKKALKNNFKVFSYNSVFGVISFLIRNSAKFDIVHAQASHILTYCIITKPFHQKKIIFTRRVDFVPKGKLTKFKYASTDKLIAISTAIKDIISAFSGRKDVEVISDIAVPIKLDGERVRAELEIVGIERQKHIIGTTAAFAPHKDPLTMVEAIRKLSTLRNDFVFLHFGSGELEAEVKGKIEEYNLKDQYKVMGFYEKVEDFFSVFEVFVMSSQEEGLGSSILDAFLYKVPVVSTDAGGIKDIVTEERGIVCKVKDFEMLAKGIDDVLNKRNKIDIISNAFIYVNDYHSMQFITDQYLKVLQTMADS